jgi:phosphate:Na+ symporter
MSLSGAVGVIFGSNIGTTTTAWIVSSLGVKIDIAAYAMPMIIFGVGFKFADKNVLKGFGNVLIGLGFIFLGIDYMKDGFETLKNGLDLSQFQIDGYLGALVYICLGIVATVVIQSSSATMAIIITALVSGQIIYINAIELAIGANIGTTITAVMGAMTSNSNGKRLALAHLIFNFTTGFVAILFLYQLADLTTFVALEIGIRADDYGMQLALFHTIFNILGVLIISPFTTKLVAYLETKFVVKEDEDILKPLYLDNLVLTVPDASLNCIKKETIHLYDNAVEIIVHAIFLHRHQLHDSPEIEAVILQSDIDELQDINKFYETKIKYIYGEIIRFSTLAQEYMDEIDKDRAYDLKLASRNIVESVKDMRDLQKNMFFYLKSGNEFIKEEYNHLRLNIAQTIEAIEEVKESDDMDAVAQLELLRDKIRELKDIKNNTIDSLIRENKIDTKMATSLINDSLLAYDVAKKLIAVATIVWIKNKNIRELGEKYEDK